jgi:hypothetical protein
MIEKENFNSERKAQFLTAKNLTGAKIAASRKQVFHGTLIELQDHTGNTVAVKEKCGSWIKQNYFV